MPENMFCINSTTSEEMPYMDDIRKKLTIHDYRSIFFLLLADSSHSSEHFFISPDDFISVVKKEPSVLEREFSDKCKKFRSKEAMLIELFGTMQRYDILKILGTCRHSFCNERKTFTQLSFLWKNLYRVCDLLTDREVAYVKGKLFPTGIDYNICCAEELFSLAYQANKFSENNCVPLADVFQEFRTDCFDIINSIKELNELYYPIKRPTEKYPCGFAIILNHVNFSSPLESRPESQLDAEKLEILWKSFGFRTRIFTDYTHDQVLMLFDCLSKMDHSSHDAFVVCYLSHGAEDVVYASDCKAIKINTLVNIVANECPYLFGKPKLFFIQACQGNKVQQGVLHAPQELSPEIDSNSSVLLNDKEHASLGRNISRFSDVLLFKSTIPGFVSFRPHGTNSWFIEALVQEMEKFGDKQTIYHVMTRVKSIVTQKHGDLPNIEHCKQTPISLETFVRQLQLKKIICDAS